MDTKYCTHIQLVIVSEMTVDLTVFTKFGS